MKKHLTSLFAGAALTVLSGIGGASAQWYDGPRIERPLSPREIRLSLEDRGYDVLGPPRFRSGPGLYIADAIDRRGRRVRVTLDAFDGSLVERVVVERDRRRFERDDEEWRPAPRPGRPRFEDRDDDAVDWGEEIARRPRSMVEPPRQRFASRPEPREAVPDARLPNRAPLPPTRPPALVETPGAKPVDPPGVSVAQRAPEPRIDVPALPEVDAITRTPRDLTPEERQEIIPALPQASGG